MNHNANVIGPLSAMSQSEMDYSSNRFNPAANRQNEEIGPGFFGRANMYGSGAGTVIGGQQENPHDASHNYSYSDLP